MTKPLTSAETKGETGILSAMAPMQESLERFHEASQRFSAIAAEIATEQANFLQRAFFDSLLEMQTLSRVRGPAEFYAMSAEFAWQQMERSLKALGEIGNEASSCWYEALKAQSKH